MPTDLKAEFPLLEIVSWDELLSLEHELVRRIQTFPNGGRLLLLDPLRLLAEVGVRLGPEVVRAWESAAGKRVFARTGGDAAYDAVAAADPHNRDMQVRVSGLLPKNGGAR